jgi:hypothetical protein
MKERRRRMMEMEMAQRRRRTKSGATSACWRRSGAAGARGAM